MPGLFHFFHIATCLSDIKVKDKYKIYTQINILKPHHADLTNMYEEKDHCEWLEDAAYRRTCRLFVLHRAVCASKETGKVAWKRERGRERQTETETDEQRERERDREKQRQKDRGRELLNGIFMYISSWELNLVWDMCMHRRAFEFCLIVHVAGFSIGVPCSIEGVSGYVCISMPWFSSRTAKPIAWTLKVNNGIERVCEVKGGWNKIKCMFMFLRVVVATTPDSHISDPDSNLGET